MAAKPPFITALALAMFFFCANGATPFGVADVHAQGRVKSIHRLPDISIKEFQNAMFPGSVVNDRKLFLGSIGSDLWRGPSDAPGEFWMVTDRGPNGQVKVDGKNRRTFLIPEFNPTILRVKIEGDAIRVLETVPIVGRSGKPVTGVPNLKGVDEVPYDFTAQKTFDYNVNGMDTEGLIRLKNGEFWLTEEYGPSLIHVDRSGKVIKRIVPEGIKLAGADYPVEEKLPAILSRRKINRGFEGLALSADEKTLYLVLQSPLSNPTKKTGEQSRATRVYVFDREKERVTAEYVYQFDEATEFDPRPKMERDEMKLSAAVALNPTKLMILERTDWVAKLYNVDLSKATNILGSKWDDPATAPSLEAIDDPASADIRVLPKSLVLDLSRLPNMPEKIEGVALLDRNTLAISNDNDFDNEEGKYDEQGNNIGKGKRSEIIVIGLDKPLPLPSMVVAR